MNVPKLKYTFHPFDPFYKTLPYGSASIEFSMGPADFTIRLYPKGSLSEYATDLEVFESELLAAAEVVRQSINSVKA